MKISYVSILLIILFIGFYSCKNEKNPTVANHDNEVVQDTVQIETISQPEEINLEPVTSDVPEFSNPDAEAFVQKTKLFFQEMAEATKEGNTDKVLQLQIQAVDIDTEFQRVKKKLNKNQQNQLSNWYMKLVEAASQ